MAELALGILGLAGPALTTIERILGLCDRIQNAPSQIRQLRTVAYRLQKNLNHLQRESDHVSDGPSARLPTEDQEEILQALSSCEAFLKKHVPTLTNAGKLGALRRAAWSLDSRHSQELDSYRDRIDSIYVQIISPFYLRFVATLCELEVGNRD